MEIGELGLAHVCFQYYETENIKTAQNTTLDPTTLTPTRTPAVPIELCREKIGQFLLKIWSTALKPIIQIFPHFNTLSYIII